MSIGLSLNTCIHTHIHTLSYTQKKKKVWEMDFELIQSGLEQ